MACALRKVKTGGLSEISPKRVIPCGLDCSDSRYNANTNFPYKTVLIREGNTRHAEPQRNTSRQISRPSRCHPVVDRIAVEYHDSGLVALLQFHCTVARAGTSRSGRTMNSSGWQQPPLTREEKREVEEVGQDQTPINHTVGRVECKEGKRRK